MAQARKLWPLAVVLWLCFGLVTWAQVQVSGGGAGVGSAGSGNGVTGFFADGSATAPSIAWATDADGTGTGSFRRAANEFNITINGTERFRFSGGQIALLSDTATLAMGVNSDIVLGRGGSTGTLRVNGGTTPTSTNCGGAGLTITGNNINGSVILGAAPPLPCDINFNGTWTSAPHCYLNPEVLTTGTTTVRATNISTTLFRITSTAALVATDKVTWWCVGE